MLIEQDYAESHGGCYHRQAMLLNLGAELEWLRTAGESVIEPCDMLGLGAARWIYCSSRPKDDAAASLISE